MFDQRAGITADVLTIIKRRSAAVAEIADRTALEIFGAESFEGSGSVSK